MSHPKRSSVHDAAEPSRQDLPAGATVREALRWIRSTLEQQLAGAESGLTQRESALEAEVMLAHVLHDVRVALYAHPHRRLTGEEALQMAELLKRRVAREPVAYLVGHREFYGLDLLVDRRVLIPRPETELVVERAVAERHRLDIPDLSIVDVGSGSGAIALALAKELPLAIIYAIDLSPDALAVAATNCLRLGIASRITLLHGDLLAPLPTPVHLITANLPYVTEAQWTALAPEVARHEPRVALVAGMDGIEYYVRLLDQATAYLLPRGSLVLEIAPRQAEALRAAAAKVFPTAEVGVDTDLAGHERVLWVRLP